MCSVKHFLEFLHERKFCLIHVIYRCSIRSCSVSDRICAVQGMQITELFIKMSIPQRQVNKHFNFVWMIDDKVRKVAFSNCWIIIWYSLSVVAMMLCPVYWWPSNFAIEKWLSDQKEFGVAKQFYHYWTELVCVGRNEENWCLSCVCLQGLRWKVCNFTSSLLFSLGHGRWPKGEPWSALSSFRRCAAEQMLLQLTSCRHPKWKRLD